MKEVIEIVPGKAPDSPPPKKPRFNPSTAAMYGIDASRGHDLSVSDMSGLRVCAEDGVTVEDWFQKDKCFSRNICMVVDGRRGSWTFYKNRRL
jgi:hypothetical protein